LVLAAFRWHHLGLKGGSGTSAGIFLVRMRVSGLPESSFWVKMALAGFPLAPFLCKWRFRVFPKAPCGEFWSNYTFCCSFLSRTPIYRICEFCVWGIGFSLFHKPYSFVFKFFNLSKGSHCFSLFNGFLYSRSSADEATSPHFSHSIMNCPGKNVD